MSRSQRGPFAAGPWRLGALLAVAVSCGLIPRLAGAEELRIGTIELDLQDVYPDEGGVPQQMPYSMANWLHVRTRLEVVRRELLFAEGDVYQPELLAETERNLRRFRYLRHVRVEASQPAGGLVNVRVHTIDAWSTKLQVNLGSDGGEMTGSAGITEDNLLGFGKALSAFYVVDSERDSARFFFQDPRVRGSPLSLGLGYAFGSELTQFQAQLSRPFSSSLTPWSWGGSVETRDVLEFLYDSGEESLRFVQDRRRIEAFLARSLRSTPELIRRVRVGWRWSQDEFAPEQPGESLPASFDDSDRRFIGPVLSGEWRQINFIREQNINSYGRDEDFNLGTQLSAETGLYAEAFGSMNGALGLGASVSRGLAFGSGSFAIGSVRASGRLEGSGLRNGQLRFRVDGYNRIQRRVTLAASVQADILKNADPEQQVVLGGEEGLRGYKLRLFTGNKGMLSHFEARVLIVEDLLKLCSIGAATFVDAGNVWEEGEAMQPFDENVDFGAGLRVSFPRSSLGSVFRLDLSYALQDNGLDSPWLVSFGTSQSF